MTPFLDVSDITLDPDLADSVNVIRREAVVNAYGENTTPAPVRFDDIVGTVTQASPNDLMRAIPDYTAAGQVISFVTPFRLYGPAKDGLQRFQPDLIEWNGDIYIVKVLEPYTRFGAGQVQALCEQFNYVASVEQS